MTILDKAPDYVAIPARTAPSAIAGLLVANASTVHLFLLIGIALLTICFLLMQMGFARERRAEEREAAERARRAESLREERERTRRHRKPPHDAAGEDSRFD